MRNATDLLIYGDATSVTELSPCMHMSSLQLWEGDGFASLANKIIFNKLIDEKVILKS